jgi:cell division protein FtsB
MVNGKRCRAAEPIDYMDIHYYRKFRPRNIIASGFRRLWKRPLLRWIVLVGVPFLLFATFSNKGILQRMRLEEEKKLWQQKVQEAQAEQQRLQEHAKALENDKTPGGAIEKVARERYGMVRKGDTVYKLKK